MGSFRTPSGETVSLRTPSGETVSLRPSVNYPAYSTVVVTPSCGELRAFSYPVGGYVTGTRINASFRETNLRVANCFTEESEWSGFSWSVAAVTPEALTPNGAPYRVTQADIEEFLQLAFVALYVGRDKSILDVVPDQHAVEHDAAGWRQQVKLPLMIQANRLEKFWASLRWPRSPVRLSGPDAALAVTFRLMPVGEYIERVFGEIPKRESREKLYVAVGKQGLEQLLEELVWWPPTT